MKYSKSLVVLFGILTAVVVLFTQTVQYNIQEISNSAEQVDIQTDDDSEKTQVSIKLFDAVSSYAEITLDQALYVLSSIHAEVQDRIEIPVEQELNFNSLFKTLFRLIIAPNAP